MQNRLRLPGRIAALVVAVTFMAGAAANAGEKEVPEHIARAVASEERPQTDRDRDADRKPDKVLAFFGLERGMTVLDVNSGGGYYTEILSRAVGRDGKVYAHNDDVYWNFVKDQVGERYDGRLANVEQIRANVPDLKLEPNSVDLAIMVLALHDFYAKFDNRSEPVDVPAALKAIKAALKPGGKFGIIDHAAKPGSPPETGDSLHRIDEDLVKRLASEAGFTLVAEGSFLRHPEDDRTQGPFTKGLRGKTDRFILLYSKPSE